MVLPRPQEGRIAVTQYEEETLAKIRVAPPGEVLDLVEEAWDKNYGSALDYLTPAEWRMVDGMRGDKYLRLATGGWSWNEEVIEAFGDNTVGWEAHWVLSVYGGLHIFRRTPE